MPTVHTNRAEFSASASRPSPVTRIAIARRVEQIRRELPEDPTTADILSALVEAEAAGYRRCLSEGLGRVRLSSNRSNDAQLGMTWWNGLTAAERREWMRRAGDTGVAADAWDAFKAETRS